MGGGSSLVGRIKSGLPRGMIDIRTIGTTEAIFLERPQYYDLIIDLTTIGNGKGARPALSQSKKCISVSPSRPLFRLSTVRFTWSDVKLVSFFTLSYRVHS